MANKSTSKVKQLEQQVDKLEAENKRLKGELKTVKTGPILRGYSWFRSLMSTTLMLISAALIVFSINFIWLQDTLLTTNGWVEVNRQIINTESVARDISNKASSELLSQVDVSQFVADALPPRAAPLAGPITSGIEGFAKDKTYQLVASDRFGELWVNANEQAHSAIIQSIESLNTVDQENNSSNIIFIEDDKLMANLRPVMDEIKSNLVDAGVTFLPEENIVSAEQVTFEVAQVENLPRVLAAFNLINTFSYWLPALGVAFGMLGVYLARNKRKALIVGSLIGLAIAVLQVQLIKIGQYSVAQAVVDAADSFSSESSLAVYNILTAGLVTSLRRLMVGFVLIAAIAGLSGQSRLALWIRSKIGGLFSGKSDSGFYNFVASNATSLIGALSIFVAALIVFVPFGSPWYALWLIILDGVLAVVILSIKSQLEQK